MAEVDDVRKKSSLPLHPFQHLFDFFPHLCREFIFSNARDIDRVANVEINLPGLHDKVFFRQSFVGLPDDHGHHRDVGFLGKSETSLLEFTENSGGASRSFRE